jgi:Flp pilus assembly protein TadG
MSRRLWHNHPESGGAGGPALRENRGGASCTNFGYQEIFRMVTSRKSFLRDDSGSIGIITAFALVVVLGVAALVIDVGHLMVVKNELQNAADACAMAGAQKLVPYVSAAPPTPDWSSAQTAASGAISLNKSDAATLTNCQVQVGYWNLISKQLLSTGITPTFFDSPAVTVRIFRSAENNAGPVSMFFAKFLGKDLVDVSAQSTAMISCPSTAPAESLFPVAINYDFVVKYFDQYTSTGAPKSFYIGSDYHYDEKEAGQWTSFFEEVNNTTAIRDLIYNGNPEAVQINQNIYCMSDLYIQPGTKNSLYTDAATKIGKTVFVPVVNTGFDTHAWNPVVCYLPIFIEDSVGKNKKYIKAHFVKNAVYNNSSTGGICFGAYSPPRIVR